MDESRTLTIGEVARGAGVGVETIRFYERKGLIAEPPRRPSGYRQYPPDAIRRVQLIHRAKALGFTLREIGELLSLRVEVGTTCADVRHVAHLKIADIDERVEALGRMRAALERLARSCRGRGSVAGCPILDALDREADRDGRW